MFEFIKNIPSYLYNILRNIISYFANLISPITSYISAFFRNMTFAKKPTNRTFNRQTHGQEPNSSNTSAQAAARLNADQMQAQPNHHTENRIHFSAQRWPNEGKGSAPSVVTAGMNDQSLNEAILSGASITTISKILKEKPHLINCQNEFGSTPLHSLCMMKDNSNAQVIAMLLLDNGANPYIENNCGYNLMLLSIKLENTRVFQTLVDEGVDLNRPNSEGLSVFDVAAQTEGNIFYYLYSRKEIMPSQNTLSIAVEHGKLDIVYLLLTQYKNININHKNNFGQTPLMIACKKGHLEIIERLIKAGADTELKDNMDLTALDLSKILADRDKQKQIAALLANCARKPWF